MNRKGRSNLVVQGLTTAGQTQVIMAAASIYIPIAIRPMEFLQVLNLQVLNPITVAVGTCCPGSSCG